MAATVADLLLILDTFFPPDLPLTQALIVLFTLASIHRILQLHNNQRTEPRQPARTAWLGAAAKLVEKAFQGAEEDEDDEENADHPFRALSRDICQDLDAIYEVIGLDPALEADGHSSLLSAIHKGQVTILTTPHNMCILCDDAVRHRSLRLRAAPQKISVLEADFRWTKKILLVSHCMTCGADYYPDRITYKNEDGQRVQRLEYNATHLRFSRHGLWASRRIALAQEHAVREFRAGWSNFANWINGLIQEGPSMTYRQSKRLFLEHFCRRLLVTHGHAATFECPANIDAKAFASAVRNVIGRDGGILPPSMHHGCMDCTHRKRYRTDLVEEGLPLEPDGREGENAAGMVNEPQGDIENHDIPPGEEPRGIPPGLPDHPPVQEPPQAGQPRGYVRMAVMDGKTIGHRICAVGTCKEPLVNYKNGRFCATHLEILGGLCGIIPCGRPRSSPESTTCDNPAHVQWQQAWSNRFVRLSFPGIRRVIREQRQRQEDGNGRGGNVQNQPGNHATNPRLPALGDLPGDQVTHTFRARSLYGVETLQWACGMPIGWGKCYNSESAPQVLSIINEVWKDHEELRPGFLCFDDACDLLRHIVTQNIEDPWLKSTKFIVDAWHYIGHKATDLLCRYWCNPAPVNGSQPDLIQIHQDATGRTYQTRAFNTETAEQFNAWLSGYEAPLRNMTDVNFDIFVHVIFLLFAENIQSRIDRKDRDLPEDFWDEE